MVSSAPEAASFDCAYRLAHAALQEGLQVYLYYMDEGVRGVGDKRAYVWGNRGVLIKTSEGEVFLGHNNPEQIIRDLDLMTRNHEARGAALSS